MYDEDQRSAVMLAFVLNRIIRRRLGQSSQPDAWSKAGIGNFARARDGGGGGGDGDGDECAFA